MLLLVLLLVIQAYPLSAQQSKALRGLVDQIVAEHQKEAPTQALVVGIIDGEYVYKYSYGQLAPNTPYAPDSSTLFHIGSITKVFTTSLLVALEKDQCLSLSDTITQYLPDSLANNPFLNKITLEQLATHTSGLPKKPFNIPPTLIYKDNPYANYQIKDAYHFLMQFRPTPRKKKRGNKHHFNYSHFGMGLLAHLLENASGMTYDSMLHKYITTPLNMQDTHLLLNEDQYKRLAKGHHFSGRKANELYYASLYGSEGLRSTLEDMLRFVQANMQLHQNYELDEVLSVCHEPQFPANMRSVQVAYGWYVISHGKKKQPTIITHSGRTGGYSNYIAFEKERQVGVVILSNSANRIDEIGIDIIELLLR